MHVFHIQKEGTVGLICFGQLSEKEKRRGSVLLAMTARHSKGNTREYYRKRAGSAV